MLDVARDIAKIFDMPESKIVHVKDRAFNDQCATWPRSNVLCLLPSGLSLQARLQSRQRFGIINDRRPPAVRFLIKMLAASLCRRYFICDKKLAQLGWVEKVQPLNPVPPATCEGLVTLPLCPSTYLTPC